MKSILLQIFYLSVFISIETFAALPPDTVWTRTFGGTNIDIGHNVKQTSDSGYIVTGYTRSFGTLSGRNMWLLKTDKNGIEEWNNTYGGNNDEEAYSVLQTNDGGFVITGYTKSSGAGLNDVVIVKTNSSGTEQWKKTFGGAQDDEGFSISQTSDGGFIIAGVTSSFSSGSRDGWLIKTDSAGNEQWKMNYGGLSSDGFRSVQQTSDGGFIMTGWTLSYGPGFIGSLWLVKADSAGIMEWHKYFGGEDADRGYSVKQTNDNGFIVTGYTSSSGAGLDDMLLIKTDSLGNEIWYKTFGGSGRDYGNSVQQTIDGGFVVTGYTLSFGAGGDDLWVVKTDVNGNEEWSDTFGGTSSDVGYAIQQTFDGGLIITGHTLSYGAGVHDLWLIKLEPFIPVELVSFTGCVINGNVILSWTTASELNNKGFEVERKTSGINDEWIGIAFIEGKGTTTQTQNYSHTDNNLFPGSYLYRLKQIDYDGSFEYSNSVEVKVNLPGEFTIEQNYPNPFNPSTTIQYIVPESAQLTIKLYDLTGQEIVVLLNEFKEPGSYELNFNAVDLPSGIYFYQMNAEPEEGFSSIRTAVRKMVLIK